MEAVGRKARDLMRRRYPAAVYSEHTESDQIGDNPYIFRTRERKGPVEVVGDHTGMLLKLEQSRVLRAGAEHHRPL